MEEQRRWERQRESDITQLQWELNDWRSYIHELERQLGLPLSGVSNSAEADAEATAAERSEK